MSGVLTNQILSAFLSLLALWMLARAADADSFRQCVALCALSGALVGLSNFVRPDAVVVLAAVAIASLTISRFDRSSRCGKWPPRLMFALAVIATYAIVGAALSFVAVASGVTPWAPETRDAGWKFVAGTCNESSGGWNRELIDEIERLESDGASHDDAELTIICENLSDPLVDAETILKKNRLQWWGDTLSYAFIDAATRVPHLVGLVYDTDRCCRLLLVLLSLLSAARALPNPRAATCFIAVASTLALNFLVYLPIEVQPRYSYFFYLLLFIFAAGGIEVAVKRWQLMGHPPAGSHLRQEDEVMR